MNVTVPVAAPSSAGAVKVTVCSPLLAGIVTVVSDAVNAPVVEIFTVTSSVPGFWRVIVLVADGSTRPKLTLSPVL